MDFYQLGNALGISCQVDVPLGVNPHSVTVVWRPPPGHQLSSRVQHGNSGYLIGHVKDPLGVHVNDIRISRLDSKRSIKRPMPSSLEMASDSSSRVTDFSRSTEFYAEAGYD